MSAGILRKAGFSRLTVQALSSKDIVGQRSRRAGNGTSVMWFRNDLRVADNEALLRARQSSSAMLPVYALDARIFGTTHVFKFPKTGELRALCILESLEDLRKNMQERNLDLLIRLGIPEDVVPSIAGSVGAHTVVTLCACDRYPSLGLTS